MLWKEVGTLKYTEGISQMRFGKTPNKLRVPFVSLEKGISGKENTFPRCPTTEREKKWHVLLTAGPQLEQSRQRIDEVREMLGVTVKSVSCLINAVGNYWRLTQS